jgi:Ni/Co efflux regulator RcnB
MKKLILSAIAAMLAVGPIAATAAEAAPQRRDERQTTVVRQKPNGRIVVNQRTVTRQPQFRSSWRKGERFDRRQARNYRQIDYRQYRGLRAPPRGYRYYQSGNDAVLVGITSGVIASVIAGAIR